ncbi:MAG: hypothetical protein JNM31_03795 [Flavobacteriales bacterium]|nr:hypothetical protein [Flavobacteriales bacterium]
MDAIIDLGTNTFNLLVFEGDADGKLHVLHSLELPVFLGRGGIERGVIADDAFARGMDALRMHVGTARGMGATHIRGFGTSALRNSANAGDFLRAAWNELALPIDVVPGEEEASLILDGVRQAVPFGARPMLVMDIGGGSIEFILATDKALMWKRSFELGVTRLRERIPLSDPPTVEEELRLAAHLDHHLEPLWAVIERHEPHVLVGSAGSFDSLARMVCAARGEALEQGTTALTFTAQEFDALKEQLMELDRSARLNMPGLPEHRVDTMAYALVAIDRVLLAGGIRDMLWSAYALKEGAAVRLLTP